MFIVRKMLNDSIGLWFLWSLLINSLIVLIIHKLNVNIWVRVTLAILAVPLISMLMYSDELLYMYLYFGVGFAFKIDSISMDTKKASIVKYGCIALYILMICFFEEKHYIYTSGIGLVNSEHGIVGQLWIDMFRYLIGLVGCVTVIVLLKAVYGVFLQDLFA